MEMKKNHIAVVLDDKGECVSIAKCKLIDDNEFLKLQNQVSEHKQAEQKEKEELEKKLQDLESKYLGLEKEIKFLKGE